MPRHGAAHKGFMQGGGAFEHSASGGTLSGSQINTTFVSNGNCMVVWVMTYPAKVLSSLVIGTTTVISGSAPVGAFVKQAFVEADNNASATGMQAVAILGQPKGSLAATATFASAPSLAYMRPVSYWNIDALGSFASGFSTGTPAMGLGTIPSGSILAQGFCGYALGSLAFTSPTFTQRISSSQGSTALIIAGDQTADHARTSGMSAVTNNSGGFWGGISIPLLAAA